MTASGYTKINQVKDLIQNNFNKNIILFLTDHIDLNSFNKK